MANSHSLDLESGSSQYAAASNPTTLNSLTTMTVEFWAKPESLAIGRGFISRGSSTNTQFFICASGGDSSAFQVAIASGTSEFFGNYGQAPTSSIASGAWHHYAVVFDGGQSGNSNRLKVYIDASEQTLSFTGTIPSSLSSITQDLQVGMRGSNETFYYDGLIDEIRIWNVARTSQEITDYKDLQVLPSSTGLIAYWRLNNTYEDETSSNYDLTASGSPVFSTDIQSLSDQPSPDSGGFYYMSI